MNPIMATSAPAQADVAVLGHGVAGMLCALALADAGATPLLLDTAGGRPLPAVTPVHRLPESLWHAPPPWLAGLADALKAVGAVAGVRHVVAAHGTHRQSLDLLPDKAQLECALRRLVQQQPAILQGAAGRAGGMQRMGHARATGEWRATECGDAPPWRASALVDASGARRASLPCLAAAGAALPDSEVCCGRQTYHSLALQLNAAPPRQQWLIDDGPGQAWLVDVTAGGRLTITRRVEETTPTDGLVAALSRALARRSITRLGAWLQTAQPLGPPCTHRAPPARRLLLTHPPAGWLAVGDALVQTPPWQGNGVAQARQHAEQLGAAWAMSPASASAATRLAAAAPALDRIAARQLQAAALATWAESTCDAAA